MTETPHCDNCGGMLSLESLRLIERLNRVSQFFNARALCDSCWAMTYPDLAAKQLSKEEAKQNGPKRTRKKVVAGRYKTELD
jgi:hypothetical protein